MNWSPGQGEGKEGNVKPVDIRDAADVAVSSGHAGYPADPPYSPSEAYPEYAFGRAADKGDNAAYRGVREVLRLLGLDADRYGTAGWNPLADLVAPGGTIVIKPNFVRDFRETHPGDDDCLITHGAVLRAVADYALLALGGRGRLVIADAPQNDADFARIVVMAALRPLQAFYRREAGVDVEVIDLRPEQARKIDGVIVGHDPLPGDPAGYAKVDFGRDSAFAEIGELCGRLYGAEYDKAELRLHHHDDIHEYLISRTVLDADLVVDVPKLKTHKKAGVTACMKNLVGINGNKNWLPHHREGIPAEGGDEFPSDSLRRRLERPAVAAFKWLFPRLGPLRRMVAGPAKATGKRMFGDTNAGTIRSGNWYGNDTVWRMVHDLNRALLYAQTSGRLADEPCRRVLHLVDAIVAGEGYGPLDATPRVLGQVLGGMNPVAIDYVCAHVLGFDPARIPVLERAWSYDRWPLVRFAGDDVRVVGPDGTSPPARLRPERPCQPPPGWRGHVEQGRDGGLPTEAVPSAVS